MPDAVLSAEITPTDVVAGESTEFIIRVTVQDGYTEGPSRLIYDFSAMLGTSCPTLWVNEAGGYVELYVSNPRVDYRKRCWDLDYRYFTDREHPPSREAQRMVVVDLSAGLLPGDTIELHWGETYGGFGPGAKVTTVVPRPLHYGYIDVRYFEGHDEGLPDEAFSYEGYERPVPVCQRRVAYRVRPRDVHHLRCIRKLDRAILVPLDLFWNVAEVPELADVVEAEGEVQRNSAGAFVYADKHVHVRSKGLPLRDTPDMSGVFGDMNLYWGDIHTHSTYSIDCICRSRMDMTPAELMAFARDRAGLDFLAVTDHHQPWGKPRYHLGRAKWENTMADVHACHVPGEFVAIPGIEYRAKRGDTAIVFNWVPSYGDIDCPEWTDIRQVWDGLRGRDYMSIPHFHAPGALAEGEWWENPDFASEPVLEIFSDHGSYEREDAVENGRADCKAFRRDRCGVYFLKQGYRYGFVANSDDHKGHVGVNGVTAVFADSLDRDALFDAYRKRHVYGTTNARIRLLFTGNGELMGAELPNPDEIELEIDVVGENVLKKVDLFRNGDLFKRFVPDGIRFHTSVRAREEESTNWYVRVTQVDNHIAYSSPIWFDVR